jgi:hypothetical protein
MMPVIDTNKNREHQISVILPNVSEPKQKAVLDRVVGNGATIVRDPGSRLLAEFYDMLIRYFDTMELEPLNTFQDEIRSNSSANAAAEYLCVVFRDPARQDKIISGTYGSVQKGVLAIRFTVTEDDGEDGEHTYRGSGLSQAINRILVEEAKEYCRRKGVRLYGCYAECVDRSESFWNRWFTPPLTRLYASSVAGPSEIFYELPHIGKWSDDGLPIDPESPQFEHLQISHVDHQTEIPVDVVERLLMIVWREWYVKSPQYFRDRSAWTRHQHAVIEETLCAKILAPLRIHKTLQMLTRAQRDIQ